mmetsp:Transcript_55304/g.131922  ORF Transcript_55304/g.131922 Transcript_55304/m.131922 type:complete len:237 (+) Transcript_55304:143-853(+)
MVRYKLYRSAVASAAGATGELLTRQLLLSPLASEVLVVGKSETRAFDGLAAGKAKLRQLVMGPGTGKWPSAANLSGPEALEGVAAAFCVLGEGRPWLVELDRSLHFAELCASAQVPHVSLLSSCWASKDSWGADLRKQEEVESIFAQQGFKRLSIFKPSLVVRPDGLPHDASLKERGFETSLPYVRQFLPTRYREISLPDAVMAMRLNAELCDTPEKIEHLYFEDMMQIIGKEDSV